MGAKCLPHSYLKDTFYVCLVTVYMHLYDTTGNTYDIHVHVHVGLCSTIMVDNNNGTFSVIVTSMLDALYH